MKKTRIVAAVAAVAIAAGASCQALALDWKGLKDAAKKELDQKRGASSDSSSSDSSSSSSSGGTSSSASAKSGAKSTAVASATANTAPNSEDDFDFTVNDDFTEITITKYKGTRKDVVIPASIQDVSVVRIGNWAFYDNSNITSVVIPKGVRGIEDGDNGRGAFAECRSLASVTLPKGISIGKNAFYYCKALASVTLGEDTVIGRSSFANTAITSIVIPKGSTLGGSSFSGCKSLASVTLPEGLEAIPDECFNSCKSLTQINFPSTLKYIGSGAFSNGPKFTSVDLPEGLEYLGHDAFSGDSITSVSLPKSLKWVEYSLYYDKVVYAYSPISGDNIASITIAAGCAPKVLVSYNSDFPKVKIPESVDGRNLITGATISKTIRLQKTLADWKPSICDVGKANWDSEGADFWRIQGGMGFNFHFTDDGRALLADLQRYGFTKKEAQGIVANLCEEPN